MYAIKNDSNFRLISIATFTTAVFLTACGGGGGSSTDSVPSSPIGVTPPAVTPPPTFVADTAIATNVPAASYLQTSPEGLAYALLNSERLRCGFGLLKQDTSLDIAASAHAKYLQTNMAMGHTQDATKPDFYAVSDKDRALKAGYMGTSMGDDIAGSRYVGIGINTDSITPAQGVQHAIRTLLSGPYHAQSLIDGSRDIGIGYNSLVTVVQFGVNDTRNLQKSNEVRTYPCEGTTGTIAGSGGESPSPFPTELDPIWGQPIMLMGSTDLTVTSATVTGPSGSIPIRVIYGQGATVDPNNFFAKNTIAGKATVIPSRLLTNTTYSVTVNGTNNGAAFTRSFSFKTGPHTRNGYSETGAI